jgi:hypothetical protein
MRRSEKQDLLLAVSSKMGEMIPLLTDEECDACVVFLRNTYDKATQRIESVASPALQNLSLRELLTAVEEEAVVEGSLVSEKKKALGMTLSPRPSSKRAARKRALWSEGDEGEDDQGDAEFVGEQKLKKVKPPKVKVIKKLIDKGVKKPKKNVIKVEKNGEQKQLKPWNSAKHSFVVGVEAYDKTAGALVVNAKVSAHGKAKVHRILVKPDVIDKISEEHWPQMSSFFAEHEIPASFEGTRFAKFCANHN